MYGLVSFGHWIQIALSRIVAQGSLIMQEMSQTGDDSIFATRPISRGSRPPRGHWACDGPRL